MSNYEPIIIVLEVFVRNKLRFTKATLHRLLTLEHYVDLVFSFSSVKLIHILACITSTKLVFCGFQYVVH